MPCSAAQSEDSTIPAPAPPGMSDRYRLIQAMQVGRAASRRVVQGEAAGDSWPTLLGVVVIMGQLLSKL